MKNKNTALYYLIIFALGIFLNCSSHETSSVTIKINLGLQKEKSVSYEKSVIDKILNIFESKAFAQTAPTNLTSLVLNVTGSGMDTITQEYVETFPSEITLSVPAGGGRLFEVLAYTPSATLRGAVTRDLDPGAVVDIPIDMGLYETKIVIPDYQNNRLVQIDNDFSSTSWISKTGPDLGYMDDGGGTTINPYDVDFDSSGRIYIANYAYDDVDIFRIDSINSTTIVKITSISSYESTAIAVDRINNLVYFSTFSQLHRCELDGNNLKSDFAMGGISNIRGLAIDNNGIVYIAHSNTISAYNPGAETILDAASYTGTGYEEAWDVSVKSSYIYLTVNDNYTSNNDYIVQLTFNSTLKTFNEETRLPSVAIVDFYGPRKFLNHLGSAIIFMDEDSTYDRIISVDDISGSGRINYGQNGIIADGPGYFDFFL